MGHVLSNAKGWAKMIAKSNEIDPNDRMLTVHEVAYLLHVHQVTVRRWEKNGALPSYHVGPNGSVRFKRKDILDLVNMASHSPFKEAKLSNNKIKNVNLEDSVGPRPENISI
jgi:excisionase family DNA binding protein